MNRFEYQYPTDSNRWDAYQFSDPFATNAFLCLNKKEKLLCRPNCDVLPKVSAKDDIHFTSKEIIGSIPNLSEVKLCESCKPLEPASILNLEIIKLTMDSINSTIGFTHFQNDLKRRAFSVPQVSTSVIENKNGLPHGEKQLTKNESEHIKLVELACRHIACAAVSNYIIHEQRKKRRGGILGFKELASKSKLSPWHFHRVFKSITGLTPKAYGDECWKFIKMYSDNELSKVPASAASSSKTALKFNDGSLKRQRKRKSEDDESASPKSSAKKLRLGPSAAASATVTDNTSMPLQTLQQPQPPQQPYYYPNRHFSLDLSMIHNQASNFPQMVSFQHANSTGTVPMFTQPVFNAGPEGYSNLQSFLELDPTILAQELSFKTDDTLADDLLSSTNSTISIAETYSNGNGNGNGIAFDLFSNASDSITSADSGAMDSYTLPFAVDSDYQLVNASLHSQYPVTQMDSQHQDETPMLQPQQQEQQGSQYAQNSMIYINNDLFLSDDVSLGTGNLIDMRLITPPRSELDFTYDFGLPTSSENEDFKEENGLFGHETDALKQQQQQQQSAVSF
ncbi:hypothetical protein WICPIJ_001855 [Wickerhamomyces pijperi]|uniref:Ada DNA repair metal-binding domain-containing protein n=1 Tax=Wickerhamomyces pijperi TaxID=599730 RepID=A0A9P8TQB5_WICPI|nr:hypothetical protein WICPIJ_001855 [Wickerhamomyces pijperi]